MLIHGRCHCGNIAFDLEWAGDPAKIPARACGCGFCTRHGGVWTSHPASRLAVKIEDDARVSRYEFGTRTATFYVCARCGVPWRFSRSNQVGSIRSRASESSSSPCSNT